MKTYLIFLALVSLTIVSAEGDEQEDAKTKFENMQQSMDVQLLSFEFAVQDIQKDASFTGNQSLITAADKCKSTIECCRLIYTNLARHCSATQNCNPFSKEELEKAQNYGNSLNTEVKTIRDQINAIDLPYTCRFCCGSDKYECKQDIQHYINNITTFIAKIEQEHKQTFLRTVAQRRLELSQPIQRETLKDESERQHSPRSQSYS